MELSDNCLKSLCGLAIAGGAFALGLGGIVLAAGTVELLTNAGNLALSVNAGQEKELTKIEKAVTKAITKNYKSWLAADHGDNWAKKSDVTAALDQLGEAIRQSTPRMQDMIDAGHKSEVFARLLLVRLPEKNLFRTSAIAAKIFVTFLVQTHGLVRVNETLKPMLDSLSFEKLFDLENAAIADRNAKHEETQTSIEALRVDDDAKHVDLVKIFDQGLRKIQKDHESLRKTLSVKTKSIDESLSYLFKRAGQKQPSENLDEAIIRAVDTIVSMATNHSEMRHDGEIKILGVYSVGKLALLNLGELNKQARLTEIRQRRQERAKYKTNKTLSPRHYQQIVILTIQDNIEFDEEKFSTMIESYRKREITGGEQKINKRRGSV